MTTTFQAALAIEASGLVKTFGTIRAVDGLELSVPRGGVFALLGPNGAGKTTTIRIFATLTRPDAGTARVLGHDVAAAPHAVRSRICLIGFLGSTAEADVAAAYPPATYHAWPPSSGNTTPGTCSDATTTSVLPTPEKGL